MMQEITDFVDDETIEATIAQHDDPDRPEALTVAEARELLGWVQHGFEEGWDMWMDHIENGDAQLVHADDDVLVLSTGEHDSVAEELDHYGGDVDVDSIAKAVVTQLHHTIAKQRCDYDWSTTYPYVVCRPDGVGEGQRFVQAVVNSLMRRGLPPGQAWAVYGVYIAGYSRNQWASFCGYADHSTISEAVRKAEEKIVLPF